MFLQPRRSSFYILLTRLVQNLVLELRDFHLVIATCSSTAATKRDRRIDQPDWGAAKLNRIGRNTKVLVAMLMACIFLSFRSAYALRGSCYKDCVLSEVDSCSRGILSPTEYKQGSKADCRFCTNAHDRELAVMLSGVTLTLGTSLNQETVPLSIH